MSKNKWIAWVMFALVWLAGAALLDSLRGAGDEPPPVDREGIFAPLRPGQAVRVADAGPVVVISTLPRGVSSNLKVVKVASDYLVVEDTAKVRTRIPVWAVKSVVIQR